MRPSNLLMSVPAVVVLLFATACQKAEPEAIPAAPTPPSTHAAFTEPADGATVPESFHVVMHVEGLTIEPAGEIRENSGHFHILVDTPFIEAGNVIPADANHLHFGTGVLETDLTLAPGDHTLRLQVANGAHIAYDPTEYGSEISITVE